jgi:FkbM family methyltransferase
MLQIDFIAGHSFRSDRLGPNSVVVDLGLNTGEFALELIDHLGCWVVGVEPLADPLRQLPADERLVVEHAAISSGTSPVTVYTGESSCPTTDADLVPEAVGRSTARAITLEALFEKHALIGRSVDLVKVDIEGAELEMFGTAPDWLLRSVDQFTVEYHDFLDQTHRPHVDETHRRLESLGFQRLNISWARNLDVIYLGPSQRLSRTDAAWALVRYRYLRGLARLSRRALSRAVSEGEGTAAG